MLLSLTHISNAIPHKMRRGFESFFMFLLCWGNRLTRQINCNFIVPFYAFLIFLFPLWHASFLSSFSSPSFIHFASFLPLSSLCAASEVNNFPDGKTEKKSTKIIACARRGYKLPRYLGIRLCTYATTVATFFSRFFLRFDNYSPFSSSSSFWAGRRKEKKEKSKEDFLIADDASAQEAFRSFSRKQKRGFS